MIIRVQALTLTSSTFCVFQREESQTLAQKLQQRVSSVESLFRVSGRAEGLFRSGSRDSLVRSASRESLTALGENEAPGAPAFDPPSDIESEAEDAPGNAEALPKEQLLYRLHRVEKSLANYRGKYSEVLAKVRPTDWNKWHDKKVVCGIIFWYKMSKVLVWLGYIKG